MSVDRPCRRRFSCRLVLSCLVSSRHSSLGIPLFLSLSHRLSLFIPSCMRIDCSFGRKKFNCSRHHSQSECVRSHVELMLPQQENLLQTALCRGANTKRQMVHANWHSVPKLFSFFPLILWRRIRSWRNPTQSLLFVFVLLLLLVLMQLLLFQLTRTYQDNQQQRTKEKPQDQQQPEQEEPLDAQPPFDFLNSNNFGS